MSRELLLNNIIYEGMYINITARNIMEESMRNNISKIKKSKKNEDYDYYHIHIDRFFSSKDFDTNLIIEKNNDISERDIVNALVFFSNHTDEMEKIAQTALYNHYIVNVSKEKPKARKWLCKVMKQSDAKYVVDTLDSHDFKELYLAYLHSLYIDDNGVMGMMLYTNWDTPVVVGFYDVENRSLMDNHDYPYLYLINSYSHKN